MLSGKGVFWDCNFKRAQLLAWQLRFSKATVAKDSSTFPMSPIQY